jgi:hypothetical protein
MFTVLHTVCSFDVKILQEYINAWPLLSMLQVFAADPFIPEIPPVLQYIRRAKGFVLRNTVSTFGKVLLHSCIHSNVVLHNRKGSFFSYAFLYILFLYQSLFFLV